MGKEEEIKKVLLIPILCHIFCMIYTRQPATHEEFLAILSLLELDTKRSKQRAGFGGCITDPVVLFPFIL